MLQVQSLSYILETVNRPYNFEQFACYVTTQQLFTPTYMSVRLHYGAKSPDTNGNMSKNRVLSDFWPTLYMWIASLSF
jgi:hypothetical protein